jgi:hypothetical protein
MVIAAMPSAMAWCSLTNKATCLLGSPVRNHSSHSGRAGSRGCRRSRSIATSRSVSPLPAGSGSTRRWSLSSKNGASTHKGPPSPGRGT